MRVLVDTRDRLAEIVERVPIDINYREFHVLLDEPRSRLLFPDRLLPTEFGELLLLQILD